MLLAGVLVLCGSQMVSQGLLLLEQRNRGALCWCLWVSAAAFPEYCPAVNLSRCERHTHPAPTTALGERPWWLPEETQQRRAPQEEVCRVVIVVVMVVHVSLLNPPPPVHAISQVVCVDINKAWARVSSSGPGHELVNHMLMSVVSSCSWNSRLDVLELSPIC